ncbi:MAG: DUF1801 domain-containing protein [Flavitalea sp.]
MPAKNETDEVREYMRKLRHPLKLEIEVVRDIIKNSNPKILERIKWNAPSYYFLQDLATFNPRSIKNIHIVFHHPSIVKIKSSLLEGDYKDRRMVYLRNMDDIKSNQKELERIMNELVQSVSS